MLSFVTAFLTQLASLPDHFYIKHTAFCKIGPPIKQRIKSRVWDHLIFFIRNSRAYLIVDMAIKIDVAAIFSGPERLVGLTRGPSCVQRLSPFIRRDWYVVLQTDPGCWPGKKWASRLSSSLLASMNSRVRGWRWRGWPRHTRRWGVSLISPCPPLLPNVVCLTQKSR